MLCRKKGACMRRSWFLPKPILAVGQLNVSETLNKNVARVCPAIIMYQSRSLALASCWPLQIFRDFFVVRVSCCRREGKKGERDDRVWVDSTLAS